MATNIPRVTDPSTLPGFLPRTGQGVQPARGPVTTNDIEAEQDAIKRGINEPEIRRLLNAKTGRQVPSPAASAPEFQPHEPDYVKREERVGMNDGLPTDSSFSAKTRVVGDMVTGPDPKGFFQLPKANPPGDLVTGAEVPTARRPMIRDWPSDEEQVSVNNAPETGEGSELR